MPTRHTYRPGPDIFSTITSALPRRYDPTVVVENGMVVNDFATHLQRDPPSSSPGTDVDLPDLLLTTEGLSTDRKPMVRSPATGIVREVKSQPWGRVTIEDQSGYTHTLMHNENIVVHKGQWVKMSDPIGTIGHVAPPEKNITKDHSHDTVRRPNGEMVDDTKLWYDMYTGQVLFDDDKWVARFSSGRENQQIRTDTGLDSLLERFEEWLNKLSEHFDKASSREKDSDRSLP